MATKAPEQPKATFVGALRNIGKGLFQRTAKFASYRAAYGTATTRVGTRNGTNPNSTIATMQRVGMNWTAEDVFKNSCIGAGYINQRINYCSSQITYVPATGDSGLDTEIKQLLHGQDGFGGLFATMGVDCSMQDAFMRTADIECPVRGDAGLIIWRDEQGDIRLIEFSADQIGEIYNFTNPRKCGLIKRGDKIEETAMNQDCVYFAGRYFRGADCVAYKIYERTNSFYSNPAIYDAADIIYFRDPASFRGVRGVTKFATAILHMEKGENLFQIGMDAAMRQAKTAFFVTNENGGPTEGGYGIEGQNVPGFTSYYYERIGAGPQTEFGYNGDSMTPISADSPGPELIQGVETSDERASLALGIPYAFLISPKNVSGAPSRLEVEKATREFRRLQNTIHRPRLTRLRNIILLDALNRKLIDTDNPNFLRGRFALPISPTVDAGYSADENIDNLRAGLECPQDLVAETNRDFAQIIMAKKQAAVMVAKAVEDGNDELVKAGYKPTITALDIAQLSDNPQQTAAAENLTEGKSATGAPTESAKMSNFDESKHPRGQPNNKGEFGPGGGGVATKAKPTTQKKITGGKCDERCQRAKHAAVRVDASTQRKADEVEHGAAKDLGGISFKDSEPVDVVVGGADNSVEHGIEFKHVSLGANDKLTMNTYAQIRKINWEKQNKATFHTLVYDDRDGEKKRAIYYRRGVAGSARLGSMYKCKDVNEAKALMSMDEKSLPDAAKRTDGKLRVGKWKEFQDSEGKGFRNIKTGETYRAKK